MWAIQESKKRNPYASGAGAGLENGGRASQFANQARRGLDQRLARWPRNERGTVNFDPKPVEPGLSDQILDRLVVPSSTNPVSKDLAFGVGSHAIGLHVQPEPLRPDGRGYEHLGGYAGGVDLSLLEMGVNPSEEPACRPGLGVSHDGHPTSAPAL